MTRRLALTACFALALALTLAGCQKGTKATLDTSNEAALSQSMTALTASLDEPGRQQLQTDVMAFLAISASKPGSRGRSAKAPTQAPTMVDALKPLHGLSATEIHARADALRAAAATRTARPRPPVVLAPTPQSRSVEPR